VSGEIMCDAWSAWTADHRCTNAAVEDGRCAGHPRRLDGRRDERIERQTEYLVRRQSGGR
jgi:hypothetical protein